MDIRKLRIDEKPPMELLLEADPSFKLVKEYVDRGACYIAEAEGERIGVFILLPTRPKTIELVNIAILETKRGQGFGKKMVLTAIKISKDEGYKTIEIGTGNSSIDQLALYQKCGFRIASIDADFFIRHYDDEIYENGIQCRDMIRLSLNL